MASGFGWDSLHDAVLDRVDLNWSTGEVVLDVRAVASRPLPLQLVGTAVRRFECDRQLPWGFSASINTASLSVASDGRAERLEIQMQSGDVLALEAASFVVRS